MNLSKRYLIILIISVIASLCFYCSIMFWELDVFEFEYIHILLSLAQLFLSLALVLGIGAVVKSKLSFKGFYFKKTIISGCVILSVIFALLIGYNSINYYDWYTPQEVLDSDEEFAHSFFPYHKDIDIGAPNFSVCHITGTDYITIDSRGTTEDNLNVTYHLEYFESLSPFMQLKFFVERGVISPGDLRSVDSFTNFEKIEINGVKITLFTKESGNDIGLFIKDGNKAVYAELDNDYINPISVESFAETVIKQFELTEKAVDEKNFLKTNQGTVRNH